MVSKIESPTSGSRLDSIQQVLCDYATQLDFVALSPEAVHDAKLRIVDTIGALFGGFFGEPCRLGRELAAGVPVAGGATVIGTRMQTTADMAAFVNATTSRFVEFNDGYHEPGTNHGHPSDVLMPVFAAAEYGHASGKDFIVAAVLAYEMFLTFSKAKKLQGFDSTIFTCLAVAIASAKVLGLSDKQLHHAISMAVIPNNSLRQARTDELSMWKTVASGQAGRSGVFAALLAKANFEGAHLPFEGSNGWLDHVARGRFQLEFDEFGGKKSPFKISKTLIKLRPSCGSTISSILAAEHAYKKLGSSGEIEHVTVETYAYAKAGNGTDISRWNPTSRESADHSIPYVVAVTLHDGTVTSRQFDESHLFDPKIRETMAKIEVLENPEYTKANESVTFTHPTKVTVVKSNGETVVGESGGEAGDFATVRDDTFVNEKFIGLTQEIFGKSRIDGLLETLWSLENIKDVAELPRSLVI